MADPNVPPEIAAALEKGNLIEAIKLLRQKQNMGLAEAKSVIEAMQRQGWAAGNTNVNAKVKPAARPAFKRAVAQPPRPVAGRGESHLSPGQVPGGGSSAAAIAVLVIVGLAIAAAILYNIF